MNIYILTDNEKVLRCSTNMEKLQSLANLYNEISELDKDDREFQVTQCMLEDA